MIADTIRDNMLKNPFLYLDSVRSVVKQLTSSDGAEYWINIIVNHVVGTHWGQTVPL